ncbi:MAG: hypothetical protein WDA70_03380 [Lysobacteraceae bacterium]|jgi:hypothetical protein|uniref:hypothetical protein n=1 Tax=Denitratimonas sp. CY0512 TaxID=3131940 RepID=UPI0030AA8831
MKKVLGGCLIVGLLLLVVGGGATWWFVLRPAWNAGSQFIGAATQMADLAKIDTQVKNRAAFTPPADGVISDAGLQRFIAVQSSVRDQVGPALATLEGKYKELQQQGQKPGATEVLNAYGDLFSLIRQAKQAEVDAVNAQNLSLAEYRWMRSQVYGALLREGMDGARKQGGEKVSTDPNLQRLSQHRELLAQTAVMAWLGL